MTRRRLTALLLLIACATPMIGCASDAEREAREIRKQRELEARREAQLIRLVRRDLTPELHSTADTKGQFSNAMAISVDHTTRQILDDLRHYMLLDEPLHLSHYPIP